MSYSNALRLYVYHFLAYNMPELPPKYVYDHMLQAYTKGLEMVVALHSNLMATFVEQVSKELVLGYLSENNVPSKDASAMMQKLNSVNIKTITATLHDGRKENCVIGRWYCVDGCPHSRRRGQRRCFLGVPLQTNVVTGKSVHSSPCPMHCERC